MFDKGQTIENTSIVNSTVIQGNFNIDQVLIKQLTESSSNNKLLNKLVRENLQRCKEAVYALDFKLCRSLVDTIFNYGLTGIEMDLVEKLYYYRFLLKAMYEGKNGFSDCSDFLTEKIVKEIKSVLLENIEDLSIEAIAQYCEETQISLLNQCFNKGYYEQIVQLYEKRASSSNKELENCWKYFYSLTLFNVGRYEEACSNINELKQVTNKTYHQLLSEIFEIHRLKKTIFDKKVLHEIEEHYHALKNMLKTDPAIMNGNDTLLLATKLSAALCLGSKAFIEEYNELSLAERDSDCAKFCYAIHCEEIGEFQKSLELNLSISHVEPAVIHHRLLCLVHLYRWNDVIECYNAYCAEESNAAFDGLYISALKNIDDKLYKDKLAEACRDYKEDVRSICSIGLAVEDRVEDFNNYIVPIVIEQLENILTNGSEWLLFTFAMMLFHCNQNDLCLSCIKYIKNFEVIDRPSIRQFCKEVFESQIITAEQKESLAEHFISCNTEKEAFLQLKINGLTEQMKIVDAIECSEELYELTHDENVARNIIALVVNNYPANTSQYGKYYHLLEQTQSSDNLMAAAAAYSTLGRTEEADRCAYNAILFQNDENDYSFYVRYMCFSLREVYEHKDIEIEHSVVKNNSAVTLKSDVDTVVICIENANDTNGIKVKSAIDALHVYNTDALYYKLLGKAVNDAVEIEDREYKITSIIDKHTYAFHFATSKLEENPNPETMPVKMLRVTDGADLIRQMQEAFPESHGRENVLKAYHMEDGDLGIPIEAIVGSNYEDYLEIVQYLLFGENQALYAGQVDDVDLADRKIVPTLSSLVILEAFDCLHLLKKRKDSVIIPESLLLFVRNRVEQTKKTLEVSPGKLYNLPDGKFTMIPPSTHSINIWRNIFECCLEFQIVRVFDKEVAEFPFLEQISGESLFNKFKIDRSQLECMILSKREDAVLLSDDLFYRKIAGTADILHVNSGCLLKNQGDVEFIKEVIEKMSASNYIYIPFIEFSREHFQTIVRNLSKGRYKKKYYSYIWDSINRIVSDLLSGNYYSTDNDK